MNFVIMSTKLLYVALMSDIGKNRNYAPENGTLADKSCDLKGKSELRFQAYKDDITNRI